jgi:hypothetical protein
LGMAASIVMVMLLAPAACAAQGVAARQVQRDGGLNDEDVDPSR